MKKLSTHKYSLILLTIYIFLIYLASSGNNSLFIVVSIIGVFFILISINTIRVQYNAQKQQLIFSKIDLFNKVFHLGYHLIIPILMHLATCLIIFFTRILVTQFIILIISYILIYILFKNIYSYYSDKITDEISTHKIYDVIIIYTYFIINYVVIDIIDYYGLNQSLALISIVFSTCFMGVLSILRYRKKEKYLFAIVLSLQIVLYIFLISSLNILKLLILETLLFNFLIDYLHHGQVKSNFEKHWVIEYLLFTTLIALLLFYI